MKTLLIGFVFTLFLCSCGGVNGDKEAFEGGVIIDEDSLVLIIKDMHIVDAAAKQNFFTNNSDNYTKHKQYKTVLEKYQVSKMRFDSTINLYTRHGEKFDELYEKVIEQLKEEEKSQAKK